MYLLKFFIPFKKEKVFGKILFDVIFSIAPHFFVFAERKDS